VNIHIVGGHEIRYRVTSYSNYIYPLTEQACATPGAVAHVFGNGWKLCGERCGSGAGAYRGEHGSGAGAGRAAGRGDVQKRRQVAYKSKLYIGAD
jgi:hypothetical protein